MKYAIISDVHANVTALETVLEDARGFGAEKIICLGDVVGYGPEPAEALRLVRANAAAVIAGNHDDAVSGRLDARDFIDLAGDAVERHREALDRDALAYLASLPYVCEFAGAIAAHGDFTDPEKFYYIEDENDARASFEATDAQLAFVGHTHVPGIFLTGQSGKVYRLEMQDFVLEDGKRYIVNPGSVGYPREVNGECRSTYVLYDTDTATVTFRSLPFQVAGVLQRGKNPKRASRRLLAVGALVVAAAAATAAFLLTPKTEVTNVTEIKVAEDPALDLRRETLALPPAAKKVRANLKLENKSDPVTLAIAFFSADGGSLGNPEVLTVKGSARQRVSVPEGATAAEFRLRKLSAGSNPRIRSFSPSAE